MAMEIAGIFDQQIYIQKLVNEWNGSTDPKDLIGFYTTKTGIIVAGTHTEVATPNNSHPQTIHNTSFTGLLDKAVCRIKPSLVRGLFGDNYGEIQEKLRITVNDFSAVLENETYGKDALKRRIDNAAEFKNETKLRLELFRGGSILRFIDFSSEDKPKPAFPG